MERRRDHPMTSTLIEQADAVIFCPVCGLEGTSGYAGLSDCRQSFAGSEKAHHEHLDSLKARGCFRLRAQHSINIQEEGE